MRGIELTITKGSFNILYLLKYVNIYDYIWHIPEDWIINYSDKDQPVIKKTIMNGSELIDIIENNHLIVHINIRAFPKFTTITEPKTYDEYMKSECFLVFLCSDCEYIELYCKDESIINDIYNDYSVNTGVIHMEYKTEKNDSRYMLYVMKPIDFLSNSKKN